MKRFPLMLFMAFLALVLAACQSGGPGAEDFGLAGTWEAELGTEKQNGGTLKTKGEVTFSGNTYKYSWYKKLIDEDGSAVYDWSETSRETGSVSVSPDYMEWTANSYGTAEYNEGTQSWSAVDMKSTTNDYAIYYTVEGDKLTLKEDYNLDGDFDDVIGMPETVIYTKKE
ncbi:hypothetical protein [Nitrosococcus wardiae]|uniref:Lipocalin-like domain-containing protein n=1 Tax=Nitrosococcus wardiae TaxID=1814290 RepID=A0A4P7BVA3_9GAMM|nr:hypothetical protein [Nitrosococcus wardiae]QBQ53217.1 hypothetical protein E3U44_00900 [Nitrosococcus wardiae]